MATLTYWIADMLDDHPCYSIRTKTRKGCAAERTARGEATYGAPRKIVIRYIDSFDLMTYLLSEGGAEGVRSEKGDAE